MTKFKVSFAENKVQYTLLVILLGYWFPILRYGFDPHHDGLMIASVTNLEINDSPSPFNQYGPAWFLLLKVITNFASNDFFFLTLRIVTLVFYLLATIATFVFARKFLSFRNSLNVIVLLLGIQPFVTDFNSDMIPWPSALAMFLVPLVGVALADAVPGRETQARPINAITAGASVLILVLTRVQIGIALAILTIILLALYKRWGYLIGFASGFVSLGFISIYYFIQIGWLENIIDDVFGFGSTYAFGSRATYPKPIWTIITTALVIVVYLAAPRFIGVRFGRRLSLLSLGAGLCIFFLSVYVLSARGLTMVQMLTVASRRLWISIILAAAILVVFIWLSRLLSSKRLPDFNFSLLVLTSVVAQLQVWPLFDQMHAWWSSTPAIILVVLLICTNSFSRTLKKHYRRGIGLIVICSAFFVSAVTFYATINHIRVPLRVTGFSGILIAPNEGREIEGANNFLEQKILPQDSVLNLCTNANVFFNPSRVPVSASRFFVLWSPMLDFDKARKDILQSQPTKIVTCSFVTNPIFYPEYRKNQDFVLRNFNVYQADASSYITPGGIVWKVYSVRS